MGLSKAYLVVYNVAQCLGWAFLMYRLWPFLPSQIKQSQSSGFLARNPATLYAQLGDHVRLVQTAAILEILHAAFGLVRSNPMVTAVQIFSRLAVLWLPIHNLSVSQTSPGLTVMLFAWCITEIIRYSYYAVNLFQLNIGLLTWLRYTLFIVLYPMGVLGEMWCYFDSLSFWRTSKMMRMDLPNALNFTFSPYMITIFILIAYIPGFPPLYTHMFTQRKKVLGKAAAEKKES